jgi:hypothetical protein
MTGQYPTTLRRIASALVLPLLLSACVTLAPSGAPSPSGPALPPMRTFGPATPEPAARSNYDMAQDFLDLSFRLESGREIEGFSRFEGPVTVRMIGPVPQTAAHDLSVTLSRLRAEAGVAISSTSNANASITIEFLPRRTMQARAPNAACFVAPRVRSWSEYRRARGDVLDWTTYQTRTTAAVFIPSDVAPQEVRDCLNEELAQALGPLNDLFRLPDSVFNDDNIHTVLTGFDMLMLRATYSPQLSPGMSKAEVATLLPAILAANNPSGERPGNPLPPTPRDFKDAIERALGARGNQSSRIAAAQQALAIAQPWQDHRTGFAWLTLGRIAGRNDAETSFAAFSNAAALFNAERLPIYAAHANLQLAGFALATGNTDRAIALVDTSLPAATRSQNASLLAGLMMVKATALERMGQADAAARLRLDSLGWARYGMASDADVRRRLQSIAALAAPTEKTTP